MLKVEDSPWQSHGEYVRYTFIADAMLGKLARWMRFLGFDTLYFRDIKDSRLIRIAREQDRYILTKDTRLIKIRGVTNYLLIKAHDSFHQLIEVIDSLKLRQFNPLSRCVTCNGMLAGVMNKKDVKDSVPEFIFLNMNVFLRCTECGKIFWEGSHPKNFKKKLNEILN